MHSVTPTRSVSPHTTACRAPGIVVYRSATAGRSRPAMLVALSNTHDGRASCPFATTFCVFFSRFYIKHLKSMLLRKNMSAFRWTSYITAHHSLQVRQTISRHFLNYASRGLWNATLRGFGLKPSKPSIPRSPCTYPQVSRSCKSLQKLKVRKNIKFAH